MNLNNEILTNIKTDEALNSILANFDSEYIVHIVEDSLKMKFRPYNTAMPGLNSIEQYFQMNMNSFPPTERDRIIQVRYDTYKEIIDIICRYYNLTFNENPDIDIYSAAYYIYQMFVSDFTNTIINFFINYIIKEQSVIYDSLDYVDSKKNKDSNINYSKKLYTNQKLGVIHANINKVLDDICVQDIKLIDIISCAAQGNINIISFLNSILEDNQDIFKNHFAIYLQNSNTRADIITNIKLNLQKFGGSEINNMIKKEEEN